MQRSADATALYCRRRQPAVNDVRGSKREDVAGNLRLIAGATSGTASLRIYGESCRDMQAYERLLAHLLVRFVYRGVVRDRDCVSINTNPAAGTFSAAGVLLAAG